MTNPGVEALAFKYMHTCYNQFEWRELAAEQTAQYAIGTKLYEISYVNNIYLQVY